MMNLKRTIALLVVGMITTVYSQDDHWTSHPDTAIFHYYNNKDISVELLRKEAHGKRLLVFYYEHFSIESNDINAKVLADAEVVNFILSNFYPIAVNLDTDRMEVGKPGNGRGETYRKFLKEQTFYVETGPSFSVYNEHGVLRGTKTFSHPSEATRTEFLEFLNKRLK